MMEQTVDPQPTSVVSAHTSYNIEIFTHTYIQLKVNKIVANYCKECAL